MQFRFCSGQWCLKALHFLCLSRHDIPKKKKPNIFLLEREKRCIRHGWEEWPVDFFFSNGSDTGRL